MLNTIRHMELFNNEEFNTPVTIIGAGALGSWLALYLAKLGITNITVYDFDEVESHNIANQAFNIHDIGKTKTQALQDIIAVQTNNKITIKNEKYTNQRLTGIVFLMVDSMAERKRIWEKNIKMKSAVKLMVEARMGLNMGRIYNVIPIDLQQGRKYEETLYSDDESEVSACGASMTVVTTATTIAAMSARQLINFANQQEMDNEIMIDLQYNNFLNSKW